MDTITIPVGSTKFVADKKVLEEALGISQKADDEEYLNNLIKERDNQINEERSGTKIILQNNKTKNNSHIAPQNKVGTNSIVQRARISLKDLNLENTKERKCNN